MKNQRKIKTSEASLSKFSDDFMSERKQPPTQERAAVGAGFKPARIESVRCNTDGCILERSGLKPAPTKDLPKGWEWKTLGEIAEVVGGGTPKTNDPTNFEGGSIPWVTPADLSGYTSKKIGHGSRNITEKGLSSSSARLLPAGTVLFTSRAPIGYVAIASNPISTNQGFKSFVLKEGILPDYVYWYLKGAKELATSMASGTTFLELSGAKAKQIPIPLAPIDQQKIIVAEIEKQFSRMDEAVAGLKRIKANLKRYKASVHKAAVEGKLTEEWRLSARERAQVDELESIPKAQAEKWFVYIIECDNHSYYVGHTSDLRARWNAHCEGNGADWTRQHTPKYLIHYEILDSQERAVKREHDLKTGFGRTWRKREIAAGRMKPLVNNHNNETGPPVHDLTVSSAQAGVQTGSELLKRILAERKKKWEEKNPGKKYKEPVAPDTSNLPELPEGWVWVILECLADAIDPQPSHRTPPEAVGGIPYIGMGDIDKSGKIDFHGARKVSAKVLKEHKDRYSLKVGDFIFGKIGTIGNPVKLDPPFSYTLSANVVLIQPHHEIVHSSFCFSYMNSPLMDTIIRKESRATTQAAFGIQKARVIPVPLPPFDEQTEIVTEIERYLSVAEEIETAVDTNLKRAERLRQSILINAFGGKLKVLN